MDDQRTAAADDVKHLGTFFWLAILVGSLSVVGVGYASGLDLHSQTVVQMRSIPTLAPLPPVVARPVRRELVGAHSFVPDDDEDDDATPAVEDVVVTRPGDAASGTGANAVAAHPRLAIIVKDLGDALPIDSQFAALGVPLTLALDPDGEGSAQLANGAGDKTILADVPASLAADPSGHALREFAARASSLGSAGVVTPDGGSLGPAAAARLVDVLPSADVVVDGMADGTPNAYRAARRRGMETITRDVVVDAYDQEAYVGFMLKQAAALALHTGVAVAVAHARPTTLHALVNALPMFARDGIDIVPIGALIAPPAVTER